MPITVDIRINDNMIKRYRIGRLEGDAEPDSINTYKVLAFEPPFYMDKRMWADGVTFEHRYGDGIDVCIKKGLEALTKGNE